MNKLKKIVCSIILVAVLSISFLCACSNPSVNKVISALNKIEAVAMQLDAKLEIDQIFNGQTQKNYMQVACTENIDSQTADLRYKETVSKGNVEEIKYSEVYLRGDEVFSTRYLEGDDNAAKTLQIENDYQSTLENIGISSGSTNEEVGQDSFCSFLKFADKYDAVSEKRSVLTLNGNKLIYKISKDLLDVLGDINDKTTIGDVIGERKIKKLINNLAGDDSAQDIYDKFIEKSIFENIKDIKPQKGQSLYDYVVEICNSNNFADKPISEYVVYDVLKMMSGDAEKFLNELRSELGEIKEDSFEIDIALVAGDISLVIKDFAIKIEMSGDEIKEVSVVGEISLKITADEQVEEIKILLETSVKYFKEEQNLTDLTKYNYALKTWVIFDRTYDCETTQIYPNSKYYIPTFTVKNGEVSEMYFYNNEGKVTAEYDAKKDYFKYSANGNSMYVIVKVNQLDIYFDDGSNNLFTVTYVYNPGAYEKTEVVSYEEYLKIKQ